MVLMKLIYALLLVIPLTGCQTQHARHQQLAYSGGDGSSCEQAVVLHGVQYREAGLLGQGLWLEQRYPGYRQTRNTLVNSASRQYDLVEIATADGRSRRVYFDVTGGWK
jgi:hypothetical protein